jgi:hypothetical protein
MINYTKLAIPAVAALASLLTSCTTLKSNQPRFVQANRLNTPQIAMQKSKQYHFDQEEGQDSYIERLIEQEFNINLYLPWNYPEDELNNLRSNLQTMRDTLSPDLIQMIQGKDIIILPEHLKKKENGYRGLNAGTYIELFNTSPLVLSHELDHSFCDNSFSKELKTKVESLGYSFEDTLVNKNGHDLEVSWKDKNGWEAYKHQGIFPRPYAAKLNSSGLPREYSAVLREHVHSATPFYVTNEKDAKAYKEIFEFMLAKDKFTEIEYCNAVKLVKTKKTYPAYAWHTIESGETFPEIAAKYNLPWTEIYDDNRDRVKNPNNLPAGKMLRINKGYKL